MKKGAIVGLVIIVAALAFGALSFKGAAMNMVPFADARRATDSTVQVMGAPVNGTMGYSDGALHFLLKNDQGETLPVVFKGPKPEDLDSAMTKATKITAQGTYDPGQQVFAAENLLVKCPSKYQSAPGGSERSYGAA